MLEYSTINEVQMRFATPILVKTWPDFGQHNPQLKQIILKKFQESESVKLSIKGGWQSQGDLWTWDHPSIKALTEWIQSCIFQIHDTYFREQFREFLKTPGLSLKMRAMAWANINRKGDWNCTHNHPESHWSGVYYVQAPPGAGQISLFDPRPNINLLDTGNDFLDLFRQTPQRVEPADGKIIVFPSWLQHQALTHEKVEERISIAFNIKFIF